MAVSDGSEVKKKRVGAQLCGWDYVSGGKPEFRSITRREGLGNSHCDR